MAGQGQQHRQQSRICMVGEWPSGYLETAPIPTIMAREPISIGRVLLLFLKIGSIEFGRGMATIALMKEEFVRSTAGSGRRVRSWRRFRALAGKVAMKCAASIGLCLFGLPGALLLLSHLLLRRFS